MEKTTPPPARLDSLDGLRAIAILLVLGRHFSEASVAALPEPLFSILSIWQRGGWIGVDLFFVLSGFLVSGLLFREHQRFGRIEYGRFLARRGFKIYPAFYILLATMIGIMMLRGRAFPPGRLLWPEVLFYQNYRPSIFPHAWSLAVEEHFYLLLPLLFIALSRRKGAPFAALPWVFGFVAVASLAGRIATTSWLPFKYSTHFFASHLRMDSLLFGVLLSWLWHYRGESLRAFTERWRWALAAAAVGLALPAFLWDLVPANPYLYTVGLTALYLAGGCALLLALRWSAVPRPLAWMGAHSYSIYLWHLPILLLMPGWLPKGLPPLAEIAIYFTLSLAWGILAAKLVETPFLALRDRLFPSRSRAMETPGLHTPRESESARRVQAELDLATR